MVQIFGKMNRPDGRLGKAVLRFGCVVFAGLLLAAPAHGFGRLFYWRYHAAYNYAPATQVAYYPVYRAYPAATYSCPTVIPLAAQVAPPYAIPRPAPPSQTPEPPINATQRPPTITESRSPSKYPDMTKVENCRVGFWNISGRDLTLVINGQPRILPRNRAVTLDLARNFVWQIDRREPQSERVPDGQNTHEIILRQ